MKRGTTHTRGSDYTPPKVPWWLWIFWGISCVAIWITWMIATNG